MSTFFSNLTLEKPSNAFTDLTKLPFRALYYNGMDFLVFFYLPLVFFGIGANILNIVVFVKTGVRDNVAVSFLALSTSDLLYLVLLSPHIIVTFLVHFVQYRLGISIHWLIDPKILRFPFYWYAFTFYEISILINVYISVVRCACVAIPFKVKNTFTARRAVVAFVVFFILIFFSRLPMFMKKRIIGEIDPVSNRSRVVYKELEDGGLAEKLNDIINRNIVNWVSFVIIITCLIVLIAKLKASARFRCAISGTNPLTPQAVRETDKHDNFQTTFEQNQTLCFESNVSGAQDVISSLAQSTNKQMTTQHRTQIPKQGSSLQKAHTTHRKENPPTVNRGQRQMLSSREAQVIRSVILVAVVFITCQVPLMAYSLARRFESQFNANDGTVVVVQQHQCQLQVVVVVVVVVV
ncbi:chemosensory receptor C [Elysia marginata]|uniref:Chemosensory receptor C n=1 Tax=Elysia marginata TaxID=1093978 RepID=A0AAV4I4E4_9GAST|nr:chemosensory receptor C [Elysia marginata]